jgi:Zn-finger nucleic acid-binding protein
MTRYRMTGEMHNAVDVCASCDEAWLDGGEWALLKVLQLANKMPLIFTEAWQRKVRKDMTDSKRRSILAKSIGDDAVARVDAFKAWLETINHKSDVLLYLNKD